MPIMKKSGSGTAAPAKPVTRPAPSAPKRDAFAEKLAQTEAGVGGGFTPPDPGTYNVLVTEAVGEVDGDKTNAYLECTIADEGDMNGKIFRIYYNFTDDNGDDKGGMPYFRQMLEMFGVDVEKEITNWDSMCETIAEIAKQNMWAVVDVKKKGKWTNAYLSSVPENQDDKPTLPE